MLIQKEYTQPHKSDCNATYTCSFKNQIHFDATWKTWEIKCMRYSKVNIEYLVVGPTKCRNQSISKFIKLEETIDFEKESTICNFCPKCISSNSELIDWSYDNLAKTFLKAYKICKLPHKPRTRPKSLPLKLKRQIKNNSELKRDCWH